MSLREEIMPYLWRVEHANKDIEYVISESDLPAVISKALDAAMDAGEKERYGTNKNDHPTDIAHDIGVVDVILAIQRLKEGK